MEAEIVRFIKGVAILAAFVAGIAITVSKKVDIDTKPWGAALFVSSWIAARRDRDAWNMMGCGTNYYGEVQSPEGRIYTKWFCLFCIALLPVRSFYVFGCTYHYPVCLNISVSLSPPLANPGLGLYWPSVRRTALWILPGIFAAWAVLFLLDLMKQSR